MANHLKLQSALLEFDVHGNLIIFQAGTSIHLLRSEVQQWVNWLLTPSDRRPHQLHIAQHLFTFDHGALLMNSVIRIHSTEVRYLSRWLSQWLKEHGATT